MRIGFANQKGSMLGHKFAAGISVGKRAGCQCTHMRTIADA